MYHNIPVIQFIPFLLLSFSILLLWLRNSSLITLRYAWLFALCLAAGHAWYLEQLKAIAIFIALLTGICAWLASRPLLSGTLRWPAGMLFLICALALGMHIMPGFQSLLIIDQAILSEGATPYSLYFNFDKTLVGLFILGLWYTRPAHQLSWSATSVKLLFYLPLLIATIVGLAYLFAYINFAPKIIDDLFFWLWANLLFTCMAEEALFRGLIQEQISQRLSHHPTGKWFAIIIAALLFGLAHIGGGSLYVVLAIVAGLGYGYIYAITGRIEASIIAHFSLNLVHILLFTYPALPTKV